MAAKRLKLENIRRVSRCYVRNSLEDSETKTILDSVVTGKVFFRSAFFGPIQPK
jgi:hypothetical protein